MAKEIVITVKSKIPPEEEGEFLKVFVDRAGCRSPPIEDGKYSIPTVFFVKKDKVIQNRPLTTNEKIVEKVVYNSDKTGTEVERIAKSGTVPEPDEISKIVRFIDWDLRKGKAVEQQDEYIVSFPLSAVDMSKTKVFTPEKGYFAGCIVDVGDEERYPKEANKLLLSTVEKVVSYLRGE